MFESWLILKVKSFLLEENYDDAYNLALMAFPHEKNHPAIKEALKHNYQEDFDYYGLDELYFDKK